MAWPSASSRAERSTLSALLGQPFIVVRIDLRWGFCRDRTSSLLQAALRLAAACKREEILFGAGYPGWRSRTRCELGYPISARWASGYTMRIRLLKVQNPGLRVAFDCIDLCLSHKNIAVVLLVFRHFQGDLCVGLTVEAESGSEGDISKEFLIHDFALSHRLSFGFVSRITMNGCLRIDYSLRRTESPM